VRCTFEVETAGRPDADALPDTLGACGERSWVSALIAADPRVAGFECASAFGVKDSSDVDDPRDHPVVDAGVATNPAASWKRSRERGCRRPCVAVMTDGSARSCSGTKGREFAEHGGSIPLPLLARAGG
jgi:hypothetical protein